MSSASDQPEHEVDNAHNPANWIGQNQDSPPHRMSTGAADAAKRAQHEHGTNPNCYQNENQNPVEKQLAPELTEERAECHETAAGENDHRPFQRIKDTDQHSDAADNDENA